MSETIRWGILGTGEDRPQIRRSARGSTGCRAGGRRVAGTGYGGRLRRRVRGTPTTCILRIPCGRPRGRRHLRVYTPSHALPGHAALPERGQARALRETFRPQRIGSGRHDPMRAAAGPVSHGSHVDAVPAGRCAGKTVARCRYHRRGAQYDGRLRIPGGFQPGGPPG